jgi:hypothetical protein
MGMGAALRGKALTPAPLPEGEGDLRATIIIPCLPWVGLHVINADMQF